MPVYPYSKINSQARNDISVALHILGSTGHPEPVFQTHDTLSQRRLFLSAPLTGRKALSLAPLSGKRVVFSLPQSHSAAVCFLAFSVNSNTIPVLLPSPVSAEMVNQAYTRARIDASFLAPGTFADPVQNSEYSDAYSI